MKLFIKHVPIHRGKINYPPWFTKEIILMIKNKNKARLKMKKKIQMIMILFPNLVNYGKNSKGYWRRHMINFLFYT